MANTSIVKSRWRTRWMRSASLWWRPTNTKWSPNSATRVIPAIPFAGSASGSGPEPSERFTPFTPAAAEKIPRVKGHAWDWIEAIRTGRQAGSSFDYGGPLTQVAMLGLIAIRYPNQTLRWDDKTMRFTNNEAANAYLRASYRAGWSL